MNQTEPDINLFAEGYIHMNCHLAGRHILTEHSIFGQALCFWQELWPHFLMLILPLFPEHWELMLHTYYSLHHENYYLFLLYILVKKYILLYYSTLISTNQTVKKLAYHVIIDDINNKESVNKHIFGIYYTIIE